LVSRRTTFHARLILPPREDDGGREAHPHVGQPRDAGEVRGVAEGGAVQRPGRGPDDDVGHDAALDEAAQHPDLGDALVSATREDEGGSRAIAPRVISCAVSYPGVQGAAHHRIAFM